LTEIRDNYNYIGNEGAGKLPEAMRHNSNLKKLYLTVRGVLFILHYISPIPLSANILDILDRGACLFRTGKGPADMTGIAPYQLGINIETVLRR